MRRRAILILGALALCAGAYLALRPIGGLPWYRRVVHHERLTSPLPVDSLSPEGIITAGGKSLRLAGIQWPAQGAVRDLAVQVLHVATREGVEIEPLGPEVAMVCGEVRVWHWCGNDSVRAHYEVWNLSTLLVALGLAEPEFIAELPRQFAADLRAAKTVVTYGSLPVVNPEAGVSISDMLGLRNQIEAESASQETSGK